MPFLPLAANLPIYTYIHTYPHFITHTNRPHTPKKMIKLSPKLTLVSTTFMITIVLSNARDADNLFDVCPSNSSHPIIFINGLPCKDPSTISPSDFKSSLLNKSGDTDTFFRSSISLATAMEFPGLNTLGLSAARTDIEVDGLVMPHAHPRATEMAFVRTGVVVAGFMDSNNRVFQKRLREGDVFVFPKGLLHFYFNAGFDKAVLFSVLNSQSPGLVRITGSLFDGSDGRDSVMDKLRALESRGL